MRRAGHRGRALEDALTEVAGSSDRVGRISVVARRLALDHVVGVTEPESGEEVPAAAGRLHGADRSGLGEKGWAEVEDVGHPDDSNVPRDYFKPMPARSK